MKATRAYIASLGTTGLLLASSVAVLLVVGAIVAFDGWPGEDLGDRIEDVFVDDGERTSRVAGPEAAALDAAPAAAAVTGELALAVGPGAGAPGGGGTGGGGPVVGLSPPAGGDRRGSAPGPGRGSPGGDGEAPPLLTPGDLGDSVGETTRDTTTGLGDAVGGLNPQAGQVVSDTGEALAEIVESLPAPRR